MYGCVRKQLHISVYANNSFYTKTSSYFYLQVLNWQWLTVALGISRSCSVVVTATVWASSMTLWKRAPPATQPWCSQKTANKIGFGKMLICWMILMVYDCIICSVWWVLIETFFKCATLGSCQYIFDKNTAYQYVIGNSDKYMCFSFFSSLSHI